MKNFNYSKTWYSNVKCFFLFPFSLFGNRVKKSNATNSTLKKDVNNVLNVGKLKLRFSYVFVYSLFQRSFGSWKSIADYLPYNFIKKISMGIMPFLRRNLFFGEFTHCLSHTKLFKKQFIYHKSNLENKIVYIYNQTAF